MPNWGEVLQEITGAKIVSPVDAVRRKYLAKLNKYTGRNVIAYYSGWLQCGAYAGIDINDMDMNGFMTAVCGLDCSKGLDILLHTPGGNISAAEHIVHYLRSKFDTNIRAIIPQIAMSAGTMISCSCESIVMGKQSCLGPFDPQLNGISARRVLIEFKQAAKEIAEDQNKIPIWQVIIGKYHPTFVQSCELACKRAEKLVSDWLYTNMFKDDQNACNKVRTIVQKFNEIGQEFDHDKHIPIDDAISYGLKVKSLEDDQKLQDLVLTVHHAFMHTFSQANITKGIENHKGIGIFNFASRA